MEFLTLNQAVRKVTTTLWRFNQFGTRRAACNALCSQQSFGMYTERWHAAQSVGMRTCWCAVGGAYEWDRSWCVDLVGHSEMTHAATPKRRTCSATQEDNTHEEVDSNLQPPPPDGGWGWVVVFASFMIHIISKCLLHYTTCHMIGSICLGCIWWRYQQFMLCYVRWKEFRVMSCSEF